MQDPAEAVKEVLEGAGLGVFAATSGWAISLGTFPETPNTVILLNQTGGRNPFPHLLINFPSVQVLVRGSRNGYIQARQKIREVADVLLGLHDVELLGDMYRAVNQIGDIAFLGQDDNTRPLFVANFSFIVLPAASGIGNRIPV